MPILQTIRAGITKKDIIDTDVTLMTAGPATTMLNATIVAKDFYSPSNKQNGVEVAWTMQADGEACYVEVLAARENGDVVLVWTGTLTAGAQVATDGRFYVDTFTTGVDNWPTDIAETDGGGADRMARLTFDSMGFSYFLCEYTGLTGSEDIQAVWSGY